MNSKEKLSEIIKSGKHICVGLDSDPQLIPGFLLKYTDPVFEFNKIIVDATIEWAGAYKFNFAFYEGNGIRGYETLKKSIEYIGDRGFIIGDAKRGDIGNTSKMYAKSLFEYFGVDASTINPYMGFDSVEPFLLYPEKINFLLVLTSNKGSNDFQKLKTDSGRFLYQEVLKKINEWNVNENCGIVFGATHPGELEINLPEMKNLPLLIPGVGAQGGDLSSLAGLLKRSNHNNFLINSSRGIIYKDNTENFGESAKAEIQFLSNMISEA
ncbi:MAG: orotidine-5'-phosphate decarboxylase [Ignavibacteriaceae bacterium]